MKVRYYKTLYYYEGAQVIETQDTAGNPYIGVLLSDENEYLIVRVAPDRLKLFQGGSLDLRTLLVESSMSSGWHLAAWESKDNSFSITQQQGEIPEDFLPETGLLLKK